MKQILSLILLICAAPAVAQQTRQLDAHEHGVGELQIAFDGNQIAMELHAPGADIVGFEYEAESAEDLAAIDSAIALLSRPQEIFVLPAAAGCAVTRASAELEGEDHDEHGEEDHDDHADEGHDDHADEGHDDHADEEGHDDHDEDGHDDHDEDGHDDHDEDEESHTEFHAEYLLTCSNPDAITGIEFAYFERFEGARELEVQIVTSSGAMAFEIERDAPSLDLRGIL